MMLSFRKVLVSRFIVLFTLFCFSLNLTVSAAIITTNQTIDLTVQDSNITDSRMNALYGDQNISRIELEKKLISFGVAQQQVQSRLDSMTDTEISELTSEISNLPAGGDALTTIALVFLVLLFTDIAGYTDLFPFVKKNSRSSNTSQHDGEVIDRRVNRNRKEPIVIEN